MSATPTPASSAPLEWELGNMAGFVQVSILTAHKALVERRAVLALQVINGDTRIDKLEETIEDGAIDRLTKQPQATEAHRLVAVLMINRELERIGDLAESIGHAVIELDADHPPIPLETLSKMFLFAGQGVERAMQSFLYRREDLAIEVVRSGPQIGPLRDAVQSALVQAMSGGAPAVAKMIPPLLLIARYLERISHHATNIAEDVAKLTGALKLRHHFDRLPPSVR